MDTLQTILIVEDSDDDFIATMRAFKKANLRNPVKRCVNGDQALDYLYRRGEFAAPDGAPRPGMILLDLNLPGTDGREVLRLVNADTQLNQIPIIVFTSSEADHDIARCYAAGAHSYIRKPVDIKGFFMAAERLKNHWFGIKLLPKETA